MTKYGRSPWLDGFPKSRVPSYPRHRGSMEIEAVIVGGGLTGCAAAYAFATAGVKVMLLEADQIGRGSTASDAGWIADDPGIALADLEKLLGVRDARRAWQAWRRAALDFATLLRRLDVKCSLEARESLTVAATPDQVARLKREQIARRGAGINAPVLTAKAIKAETALDASQALRGKDGATIDPYRACVGLAEAAAKRGVAMFERSPVKRITFNRKTADVSTDGGTIRTRRVIVATAMPTPLSRRSPATSGSTARMLGAHGAGAARLRKGTWKSRRGPARPRGPAAHHPMDRRRAAAHHRRRCRDRRASPARQDDRSAHRPADGELSTMYQISPASSPSMAGPWTTPVPLTVCPTSASTGTIRITCLCSATAATA
jgi:hypothetical protein